MEPEGVHPTFTAILSVELAGYSRRMQNAQAAAALTFGAYKNVRSDLLKLLACTVELAEHLKGLMRYG